MESREQREPQGTPGDVEQGSPQERLMGEDPGAEAQEGGAPGDVGAAAEGGADSPADAAREGG